MRNKEVKSFGREAFGIWVRLWAYALLVCGITLVSLGIIGLLTQ